MGRILKLVGLVFGALIALFAIVVIAVGFLFDPNDYKDQITAAVGDATGRTLSLEGDLELNLFPRLGIALGGAEFSNADGFGDAPFARFDSAELRIALLPLLGRRIEIDRASLTGLRLNLARNAAGRNNWSDLGERGGAADGQSSAAGDAPAGGRDLNLSVGAVAIADAEVTWRDAASGQDWTLTNFNMSASDFGPGRAFPLAIGFQLNGAEVNVAVESEMRALVDLAANRYQLNDLSVELSGEGDGWPGGSGEARLEFASFSADLSEQRLELEALALDMLGLSVRGDLVGQDLMDGLNLAGGIEIDEFDPRGLMTIFNAEIETADPGVLGRASVSADFYYEASSMGMRDLILELDDSTLSGSAGLRGDRFEFALAVDAINIDRYLPPPADDADDELPADTGSVDEIDLPIDRLRNFAANGNLSLAEAQVLGLTVANANFALTAGNGRMTLTPRGDLYGGTINGEIRIDVQGDNARLAVRQALASVDMAGIGRDYLKTEALAGTGNVNIDLAAVGAKVGDIKQDLDGTVSVVISDGALNGVDIWHQMMRVRAGITGPDVPALDGPARTVFDRIAVSGVVEDAVMTTNEFAATLPFAALSGGGSIDLLTMELALTANASLVDGPTLQQDPVLSGYAGGRIPLRITGTLSSPRVLPDVGALISQAVRSAVQDEVDDAVDEAQDRLRDRLRDRLD